MKKPVEGAGGAAVSCKCGCKVFIPVCWCGGHVDLSCGQCGMVIDHSQIDATHKIQVHAPGVSCAACTNKPESGEEFGE